MSSYNYGTGRRKSAVARVFLKPGKGNFSVNGKAMDEHFERAVYVQTALAPLALLKAEKKHDLYITVKGGGKSGQASAIKLGIARALVEENPAVRPQLKSEGYLTRDARVVERKKTGKPKARKSSQYSKR